MSTWHDITHICLSTDLFMHLCQRTKSFIKIPTLSLYLKLWTSIFRRFGILKWRVLGGWVWNVASFWHKLWEDSVCEWPLTQAYKHWQSWNNSSLKTWVLRHYKVVLVLITQGDIQRIEHERLSAKIKPVRQKTLPKSYAKLWLKDKFLMTLIKLRLGFLCWPVLTFWNTYGGYLTQIFNSRTLRSDL